MRTLTRNDYHLRFHGWDEGAGCRVWYFDGPVVIKVIEDSGKETTLDAFRRLDKLLEGNDWGYGEAPEMMVNEQMQPRRVSGIIPCKEATYFIKTEDDKATWYRGVLLYSVPVNNPDKEEADDK